MKFILNYLSSVKLAITLLIIITLASILGTLVPQHQSISGARLLAELGLELRTLLLVHGLLALAPHLLQRPRARR